MLKSAFALLVATIAVLPGDASARDPVIPDGASVAGLDVGGLPLSAAAQRVEHGLGERLRAAVRVRVAGHRRALGARRARLRFDPLRSARRANIAARRAAGAAVDVDPWVRYDEGRVAAFVRTVARRVERRPRGARVRYAVTRISVRPAPIAGRSSRVARRPIRSSRAGSASSTVSGSTHGGDVVARPSRFAWLHPHGRSGGAASLPPRPRRRAGHDQVTSRR